MKTNFFKRAATLLLSAGLILTTACSDDVPGGENGGKNPEGEVAYVSFSLVNSSQRGGTKGDAPKGTTSYGTEDENKVNSVLILLYDKDDAEGVVKYRFLLENIGTPGVPGSDMLSITPGTNATTYRTKAKPVAKADYKLAVFVNPPTALTNEGDNTISKVGTKLSVLKAAATVTVSQLIETGSEENKKPNFLMSNFTGLVDVDDETNIMPTPEQAEANGAAVELFVERAVAKVTVAKATEDNFESMTGANVGDITWDVDVVNTKTFWMRNAAKMLNPNSNDYPFDKDKQGDTYLVDESSTTAKPAYRYLMYATDPNMSGVSKKGVAGSIQNYPFTNITSATRELETYAYVTENTMDADEQYEDVTTSVVIAAMITPKETFFAKTLKEKTAEQNSDEYFLFNNTYVFTRTDINEILAAASDAKTVITSASSSDNDVTWEDLMKVEENQVISSLPNILKAIATSKVDGNDVFDANYFTAEKLSTSKDMASGSAVVRFFKSNAQNYYYVPIRHFDNDLQADAMTYGRYGVVRNNFYKLTLNSINKYGTATIPDPEDRKDPDDKESSWLSVQFEILSWMERNQGVGL
ncbi:hypothetical protein M2480_001558 [Parabacteroides sp. PFB2-12]|uniref:Mfa1 family fimbria major subunit n=1 Tax=unclassified Parabacteroides TaxID=2649774 RepID=UPI002475CEB3|nr:MULTISPECIES: Mfa1 family fimbria major subunit [unclassified Parabacteroides]MDH6342787.1 hypothetical protein [Parabacteroides sp. PM6-13]MDH6390583.1 hypothetical protein [Parabacteroides sp. PFB2-12]